MSAQVIDELAVSCGGEGTEASEVVECTAASILADREFMFAKAQELGTAADCIKDQLKLRMTEQESKR
jgi:hypothetical protein